MAKYKKLKTYPKKRDRDEQMRKDFEGYLSAGNDLGDVYMTLSQEYGLSYSRVRQICRYNGKTSNA